MATAGEGAFKAKVVLLGEGAVGKTSIVTRYVENRFNDKHVSTLQVSLYRGRINYPRPTNKIGLVRIRVQFEVSLCVS